MAIGAVAAPAPAAIAALEVVFFGENQQAVFHIPQFFGRLGLIQLALRG
jgi:hypothetical protein